MDKTYFSMAAATPLSSLEGPTTPPAAATTFAPDPAIATAVPARASISTSFSPSPSASTFRGSMSSLFNRRSTAAPLDAPLGRNSSIPGTAVVMEHRLSNRFSAAARSVGMAFVSSSANSNSLFTAIPASTMFRRRSPTASGVGSPYASTRSVFSSLASHRMRDPQNATSEAPFALANSTTSDATSGSSSMDSRTVPSASHVSKPWMNTPGIGTGSLGRRRRAHGPRDLPVARMTGTPHAAARAMATSVRMVSSWLEFSRVPSTSVTMTLMTPPGAVASSPSHSPLPSGRPSAASRIARVLLCRFPAARPVPPRFPGALRATFLAPPEGLARRLTSGGLGDCPGLCEFAETSRRERGSRPRAAERTRVPPWVPPRSFFLPRSRGAAWANCPRHPAPDISDVPSRALEVGTLR